MSYWLSIIFNGGFALYFFNRLVHTDYPRSYDNPKFAWTVDGSLFALNFAAFLTTVL